MSKSAKKPSSTVSTSKPWPAAWRNSAASAFQFLAAPTGRNNTAQSAASPWVKSAKKFQPCKGRPNAVSLSWWRNLNRPFRALECLRRSPRAALRSALGFIKTAFQACRNADRSLQETEVRALATGDGQNTTKRLLAPALSPRAWRQEKKRVWRWVCHGMWDG